jgi:dihydroflavonol-4-reductase
MAAVMYGHDEARTAPFGPADWTDLEGRGINAYVESKTRAERAAWEMMAAAGRTGGLAAINPGVILGPLLDDDPGISVTLVQRLLSGRVPALPDISTILVDVRDVAALHVAAMTAPEAGGQRFPTGAGTFSMAEIAAMLRKAQPALAGRLPRFRVPDWITRLYALFDADVRGNLGELGIVKRADASAARQLLGRPFIPAEDAVAATARSLIEQQLV